MARFNLLKLSFFSLSVALLLSASAKADMNYTFIKMTCDKDAKTATIKAFYDWNAHGEERVERHEKDIYYLDEVSGKKITCDLGNNQSIGFIAYGMSATYKPNYLELYLDNMKKPWENILGEWKMNITSPEAGKYSVVFCSDDTITFFQEYKNKWPTFKDDGQPACKHIGFTDGKITESHLIEKK
jgi:hypothetical protein